MIIKVATEAYKFLGNAIAFFLWLIQGAGLSALWLFSNDAVLAQEATPVITPAADPGLEALLRPTAEVIAVNMTATAIALGVPVEDLPAVAASAFLIGVASMLLVGLLLAFWLFVPGRSRSRG